MYIVCTKPSDNISLLIVWEKWFPRKQPDCYYYCCHGYCEQRWPHQHCATIRSSSRRSAARDEWSHPLTRSSRPLHQDCSEHSGLARSVPCTTLGERLLKITDNNEQRLLKITDNSGERLLTTPGRDYWRLLTSILDCGIKSIYWQVQIIKNTPKCFFVLHSLKSTDRLLRSSEVYWLFTEK